jgi:hypothetical protein
MRLDEDELVRRARRAYLRAGGTSEPASFSGVVREGKHNYVVLENTVGILAVYAVLGDRIRRVPEEEWPNALGGPMAPIVPKDYRLPGRLYSRTRAK